jgi:hypothetical protein
MLSSRPMPLNGRATVLILLAFSKRTLPRSGFVLRPSPVIRGHTGPGVQLRAS